MSNLHKGQEKLIGYGMKFPSPISESRGSTQTNAGMERIHQALHHILSTPKGTRAGNRKFGSLIHTLVFEPNDYILADLLKMYAYEAIQEWEKRIRVTTIDVNFNNDSHFVKVKVNYYLVNSNVDGSYVYPFYRKI